MNLLIQVYYTIMPWTIVNILTQVQKMIMSTAARRVLSSIQCRRFFRQIVLHKNLALVVDICGEHFVKMGKLFSSSVPKNITWLYNGNKCHISSWY